MGHAALVLDGDLELIAHLAAQRRPWRLAIKKPLHLLNSWGYLNDFLGHRPGFFVRGGISRRRQGGVIGAKTFAGGTEFGGARNINVRVGCPCHGVVVIVPAGAWRGIVHVDVKGHTLQAVTGNGAVAFDAGFDDTGIELHGIAGIDAAGFGITNL